MAPAQMTGVQPFATNGRMIATIPQFIGPGHQESFGSGRFRVAHLTNLAVYSGFDPNTLPMKFVLLASLSVFLAPAIADPITEKAAIAEAMALLEPARLALDNAYKAHGNAFPKTSEFQVPLPSSAQHVKALSYASSGPGSASLVALFGSTSNADIGGILFGFFGRGAEDGQVSWNCSVAASDAAVSPGHATSMLQQLPAWCRQPHHQPEIPASEIETKPELQPPY